MKKAAAGFFSTISQALGGRLNGEIQSARKLKAVLETVVDGVITIDERGIIQSFNPAAERIFSYAAQQVIGKNVSILMPSPHSSLHNGYIKNYLTTGQAKIIGIGREVEGRRQNGTLFPMELGISEIMIGTDERGFVGIVRDISERKKAQMRVELVKDIAMLANEGETISRDIINTTLKRICEHVKWPIGHAYVWDEKTQLLYSRGYWYLAEGEDFSEFCEITRKMNLQSGEGLPGRVLKSRQPEWGENMHEDENAPRIRILKHDKLRTGFAFPIMVKNKVWGVLEFYTAESVPRDDDLLRVLTAVSFQLSRVLERQKTEKTLKKTLENLRSSNEELETFTYIASHDLRSPLINLKGFSAELERSMCVIMPMLDEILPTLSPENQKALQQEMEQHIPKSLKFISTATQRMNTLTSGILQLSRLGRRELIFEEIDIHALVQGCVDTFKHQIEATHTLVTVECLPPVIADRTSMEHIFGNLLDNAVKYLEPVRPGNIRISAKDSQRFITFSIVDNGRGIAPDDMHKVFEIFRRAGNVESIRGEGMGMPFVRALVKRHGGSIWCESEIGQGTTFYFTIEKGLKGGPNYEENA